MALSEIRIGNFTSSEIHRLMGNAKQKGELSAPALTYIKEKQRERVLKTNIDLEASSKEISWGNMLESYVFNNMLDTSYALCSSITIVHPSKKFCGTPDLVSPPKVSDIKCPFTRKSLCDLVEIGETKSAAVFRDENPKYYWQLISNAVLAEMDHIELIVFMPYLHQLQSIKDHIDNIDDFELQKDVQWIYHCEDPAKIPHLPNDSGYKNLYKFEYKVAQQDKDFLLEKVDQAHKRLIEI